MPSWPVTLPQVPDGDGYSERLPNPVAESPVVPAITHLKFTAAPKNYTESFLMTTAQYGTFEAFHRDDIKYGSLSFDWKERGDPANPTAQFRIIGEPIAEYLGGIYWVVRIAVIRLP